ncbi:L-lactate permease [Escherichia coli]
MSNRLITRCREWWRSWNESWRKSTIPPGYWRSSLLPSFPSLFFFFALIKLKLKGYVAASWTVAIALAVALLFYKMPVADALASVVYGFFYGLWPIAWIVLQQCSSVRSR